MASFEHGQATIHYDDEGDAGGLPVLLLAPGGMRSCNVIGMDQRNAGRSSAPVSANSGWSDYRDDQIALLDHLGIERCHVIGMCIGGPFVINLLKTVPTRFCAAVLLQPGGVNDDNRPAICEMFDSWVSEIADEHPEAGHADWTSFRCNMWDHEFVATATPDEVVTLIERWKEEQLLPNTDRAIKQFLKGRG